MTTGYNHLFWKFILLTSLTTQIVLSVAEEDVITFTCGQSKKIETISVGKTGIPASRILIEMPNGRLCPYSNKTCKDANKDSPLNIVIQGEKNDNGLYAGRSNKHYSIECKDEYDVTATASPVTVSPATTFSPTVVTKSTPGLSLKLTKNTIKLTKNVYVGEELNLEMESSGYKVYPQICTAMNDAHPSDPEVPIWTYKSDTNEKPCSTFDDAITVQKWTLKNNTQTIWIPIYAFRFMTSSSVTIKCSAHLCRFPDGICNPAKKTCMNALPSNRRRRSSGNSTKANQISKTEEAYVSFSVVSENIVRNKANDVSIRFTALFTTIIFGRIFLRF